jgi:hypothetical protein
LAGYGPFAKLRLNIRAPKYSDPRSADRGWPRVFLLRGRETVVAVNFTTLFTRLGHFLYIGEGINADLGTTTPTRVNAALTGLGNSLPAEYEAVRESILNGLQAFQGGGNTALGNLVQNPLEELILLTVSDDQAIASTLDLAVVELIKQMVDNSESLDASTVGASVAYDGSNAGDGVVVSSVKRGDGQACLFAYAEDLDLAVSSIANGETTFTITGEPLIDGLAPTWPGGLGASETTTGKTACSSDNKVTKGTFEDSDDNNANLPLGWLAPNYCHDEHSCYALPQARSNGVYQAPDQCAADLRCGAVLDRAADGARAGWHNRATKSSRSTKPAR